MLGAAFALIILGYTAGYVGVMGFRHGDAAPSFWQALGLSNLNLSDVATTDQPPNLTGQPPSQAESPTSGGTITV